VDFKFLVYVQGVHAQIDISGKQVQTDNIVPSLGQFDKIHLRVSIDTEIIFSAEMDFCSSILSSQPIAFHNRQIDCSLFITHILGSLDKHISFHIVQACKRIAVILLFLGEGETKRNTNGHTKDDDGNSLLFHLSSFPFIIKAKSMPFPPPCET
jgi:hypothetical protein